MLEATHDNFERIANRESVVFIENEYVWSMIDRFTCEMSREILYRVNKYRTILLAELKPTALAYAMNSNLNDSIRTFVNKW